MPELENFREFLAYNSWANGFLLDALKNSAHPPERAITAFGHLLLAEATWLERIQKPVDNTGFDFWSLKTVENCEKLFVKNRTNFENFFSQLTEDRLDSTATYKNSEGKEFTNTCREILTHVFFHSTSHRGQIIAYLRANGETPPYIDFIGYLRKK